MKIRFSVALALAVCASMAVPAGATGDKVLQNVKGDVTYQQSSGLTKALASDATIVLANNDYAITGNKSMAAVLLPDSTRILVGEVTRVQLAFFDQQPNLTTASFILYNGKTRFMVQHPAGAKASYTFQTSAAQIGVRGTDGDVSISAAALQVNVYALSDPSLPVVVTLNDGRVFSLHAGECLIVTLTAGVASSTSPTSVTPISATATDLMSTFCEFGAPGSNSNAALAEASACRAPTVSSWPLVAGVVVAGAGIIAGVSSHGNTPSVPSPTPSPTLPPSPTPSPTPTGGFVPKPPTVGNSCMNEPSVSHTAVPAMTNSPAQRWQQIAQLKPVSAPTCAAGKLSAPQLSPKPQAPPQRDGPANRSVFSTGTTSSGSSSIRSQ